MHRRHRGFPPVTPCEETGFEHARNSLCSGLLCTKAVEGQRVCPWCRVFDSMELGVEHCEDRFLEVALQYGLWRPRQQVMSLEDTLRTHDSMPMVLGKPVDYKQVADSLKPFMKVCPRGLVLAFTGIQAPLADMRSLLGTQNLCPSSRQPGFIVPGANIWSHNYLASQSPDMPLILRKLAISI